MKFSLAWADIAAQNTSLKIALTVVSLVTITLAGSLSVLSLKEPLIIDRGFVSKAVISQSNVRTQAEIEAFLREALAQRFDSSGLIQSFLSDQERHFRQDEQKKLKASGLIQSLNTANLKLGEINEGERMFVDTDRLIAVGDVRSAFRFPLYVKTFAVSRSAENPYGLILDQVEPAKLEASKK